MWPHYKLITCQAMKYREGLMLTDDPPILFSGHLVLCVTLVTYRNVGHFLSRFCRAAR